MVQHLEYTTTKQKILYFLYTQQSHGTNRALPRSSSAICNSSDNSALCAIDLNIKLATSAAPIWSGHVFQKIIAIRIRLNNTAQTNISRSGWSLFSATDNTWLWRKSFSQFSAAYYYIFMCVVNELFFILLFVASFCRSRSESWTHSTPFRCMPMWLAVFNVHFHQSVTFKLVIFWSS